MFSQLLKPLNMYPLNPETMAQIQKFTQRLNSQPDPLSIEQTLTVRPRPWLFHTSK